MKRHHSIYTPPLRPDTIPEYSIYKYTIICSSPYTLLTITPILHIIRHSSSSYNLFFYQSSVSEASTGINFFLYSSGTPSYATIKDRKSI